MRQAFFYYLCALGGFLAGVVVVCLLQVSRRGRDED
jgi:hypothetical protein